MSDPFIVHMQPAMSTTYKLGEPVELPDLMEILGTCTVDTENGTLSIEDAPLLTCTTKHDKNKLLFFRGESSKLGSVGKKVGNLKVVSSAINTSSRADNQFSESNTYSSASSATEDDRTSESIYQMAEKFREWPKVVIEPLESHLLNLPICMTSDDDVYS